MNQNIKLVWPKIWACMNQLLLSNTKVWKPDGCSCGMYFVSRKHETIRRKNWKKKRSMKWRKTFASRQLEEHVVFMFMIEMISLSWFVPPVQTIWCKEHSSHWWEQFVNTTFTPHDWLENFRMSHDTFLHLDYLKAAISKTNTIMQNAVQVRNM